MKWIDNLFGLCFGVLYVALFYISDFLFGGSENFYGIASFVFLPAFIRLIGFLIIGYRIIPFLFVSALFCIDLGLGFSDKVILAAFLAAGGPLGAALVAGLLRIATDLRGVSPKDLFFLSLGCAFGNALFYHLGLTAINFEGHSLSSHIAVFIGDLIGTWLLIYIIKIIYEWNLFRKR